MKQILISLHGKHYEQNLPQSHTDVKSATAKNKSSPSVKLLPEHEDGNMFTPKPTLFVSTVIRVSAISFIDKSLLKMKTVASSCMMHL